jgi:translation initiation factor IF-3
MKIIQVARLQIRTLDQYETYHQFVSDALASGKKVRISSILRPGSRTSITQEALAKVFQQLIEDFEQAAFVELAPKIAAKSYYMVLSPVAHRRD